MEQEIYQLLIADELAQETREAWILDENTEDYDDELFLALS